MCDNKECVVRMCFCRRCVRCVHALLFVYVIANAVWLSPTYTHTHSADLRAMLSAGQNSSELLMKLANGWQPHLGESASGGQQQLLSSPMVAPTSQPGVYVCYGWCGSLWACTHSVASCGPKHAACACSCRAWTPNMQAATTMICTTAHTTQEHSIPQHMPSMTRTPFPLFL